MGKTQDSEAQMDRAMGKIKYATYDPYRVISARPPGFFWKPNDKQVLRRMRGNKGMHFRLRKLNRMRRNHPGLAIDSYEFKYYGGSA